METELMMSLKPEPIPEFDTDFDTAKYGKQPEGYSIPIPESKRKPSSFYTEDIPNIDRLKEGKQHYEAAFTFLASNSYDRAIEEFNSAISFLQQYVHYKYDNTNQKTIEDKYCEFEIVDGYCHLAFCYQNISHFQSAKINYLKALKILKNQYDRGEQLVQVAMNLCEVYSMLNKPAIVVQIIEAHIQLAESVLEVSHFAGVLAKMMVALADCKRTEDSIAVGLSAVEAFVLEVGHAHPFTTEVICALLRIIASHGDRELYDEVYDEHSPFIPLNTFEQTMDIIQGKSMPKEDSNEHKAEMDKEVQKMHAPLAEANEVFTKFDKRYNFSKELEEIKNKKK